MVLLRLLLVHCHCYLLLSLLGRLLPLCGGCDFSVFVARELALLVAFDCCCHSVVVLVAAVVSFCCVSLFCFACFLSKVSGRGNEFILFRGWALMFDDVNESVRERVEYKQQVSK